MAIDRANVAEAHFFKQHAPMQKAFDRFFKAAQGMFHGLADDGEFIQQPGDIAFEAIVKRCHACFIEIRCQPAYTGTDSHFVIVENDEHILVHARCVIHGFEDHA